MTRLTSRLLSSGVLVEGEPLAPRIGRPLIPLDVAENSHLFVGARLTDGEAHCVLTDFRAHVLDDLTLPLHDTEPTTVVSVLGQAVRQLTPRDNSAVEVGLCVGGQVLDDGVVRWAPYLGWRDVPVRRLLEESLGCPVSVENDLAALTNAEHWFGAGRGCSQFAVVTLGIGVGLGVVVADRMLRSADFGLGLAGHLPLDSSGPVCPRGHTGCAKAMLTTVGICSWLGDRLGRKVDYPRAFELYAEGHPDARAVLTDAARALGTYLSIVANVAQPQRIVITGEGVALADVCRPQVDTALRALRNDLAASVDLVVHPINPSQWARGAAVTAIQHYVLGS